LSRKSVDRLNNSHKLQAVSFSTVRFQACGGFSLIEILVAFTIAATALAIIFQIYSKGLHSAISGKEYTLAVMIAESRLDELGVTLSLDSPRYNGTDLDKYDWQIQITDYHSNDPYPDKGYRLKVVKIDVTWESRESQHSVSLNTLKPYMSL